jgi:hypothetical protein
MLGFPLLLIPFAIYNIIAFLVPGVTWAGVVFTVPPIALQNYPLTSTLREPA